MVSSAAYVLLTFFLTQQYVINIFPFYSSVMSPNGHKSLYYMTVLYNVLLLDKYLDSFQFFIFKIK